MQLPSSAPAFIEFMEMIWDCPIIASDDEGITLGVHKHYDEFSNARKTAIRCGAKKSRNQMYKGMSGLTYDFPDGTRVWVATDGGGCTEINKHRNPANRYAA